jgi:aromatic ring-opening dioxygenase LigB subunit
MSLNFAAISPHPPIIVPGIGTEEDLQKAADTVFGMKKLASAFKEAEIDTLIVISPHSLIYPDQFNVAGMKKLFGTFSQFGAPEIMMELGNDIDLALEIDKAANKEGLKTLLYDNNGEFMELDHGLMVPLYYLRVQQESSFKVVPIAYSNLSKASHFAFGQVLRDVAKNYSGRVGILASGDLSHRLIQNHEGKVFDKKLKEDLKANKSAEILQYDEDWLESIGECGYRSILILLGVLDGIKTKCDVLSYEGPFGVGYLVANFKLPET